LHANPRASPRMCSSRPARFPRQLSMPTL
jgi:hypothetical protein